MLNEGLSLEEIAKKRELAITTVYSHLAKLYAENEAVDPMKYISKADFKAVEKARTELENPEGLKVYFEHFEEAIDYGTIRLALAVLEKQKTEV